MGINKENQVEQCCEHETCTSYFSAFPEDLISLISSKTSARDVCRLSVVSPQFRSAAKSDLVWECFLPSNYPDIISRCDDTFASKKDFWFRTFHNIIYLDNYTK
ncbi:F-box domain containing protein, partial [Trema orientale]